MREVNIKRFFEPFLWFLGLLIVWEILVKMLSVPIFILPAPSNFLLRIVDDYQRIGYHSFASIRLIIFGFVMGVIPGIFLGYLIAKFRLAEQILYPLVIFIQGLPKITLAPLMLVWFGFSDFPKILLTALITFFPILVDSTTGFKSIDSRQYYLSKSIGASWWQTFRNFELPSAAPSIFSGLKITIVVAVTVVIVVEWMNSQNGLGYLVLRAMDGTDITLLFAVLVIGSMIGVVFSWFIEILERILLPWKHY